MTEQSYGDWIRSNPPRPTKEYKIKHMAQQTALMDLIIALQKFVELDGVCPDTIEAVIEFAANRLEMEKEQIVNSHLTGLVYPLEMDASLQAEQYYNETYTQSGTEQD